MPRRPDPWYSACFDTYASMKREVLGDVKVGPCLVRSELNLVIRENEEIRLEPKAMLVLLTLLARPGRLVAREEILARVWPESFVSDEVLTNAIRQIRRAFGDNARDPRFIETIAKKGYRVMAEVGPSRRRGFGAPLWARAGLSSGLAIALAALLWFIGSEVRDPASRDRNSVLVAEFESLSKDPELAWMEGGIADLMVTGLSKKSRLHVVTPSRSGWFGTASERRAELVVSGSFLRTGDRFQIAAHATRRTTGELLVAESVESDDPDKLIEMVDQLATRMATRLDLLRRDEPHLSRSLRDVTSSSAEAYGYYVAGMRTYYYNLDDTTARELYGRAVELDGGFAMALAKLVIVHMNDGDYAKADSYARRALQHLEGLPESERYYVAGNFYVTREENYERALGAYRKVLEIDPDHMSARQNIAYIYFRLERYREAIEELELLVRGGVEFPGTHRLLTLSYAALGEFEEGQRVAEQYLSRHPERWAAHWNLGQHLTVWGRLLEAHEALRRADALRPGALDELDRWQLNLLVRVRPRLADTDVGRISGKEDRSPALGPAMAYLHEGRQRQALATLERLPRESAGEGHPAPIALNLAAAIRQETGETQQSLFSAGLAGRLGEGNAPEWQSLFLASRAQARLGNFESAEKIAAELERRTASIRSHKERRRLHLLRGELALIGGERERAIEELEAAQALLPPRGFPITQEVPQHVPIWYALGEAYRVAERPEEAMRCYRRIVESTTERLAWPIAYVRSFYRLAELHEARGEWERASERYRDFLDYWERGELDREQVELARTRVAKLERTSGRKVDPEPMRRNR